MKITTIVYFDFSKGFALWYAFMNKKCIIGLWEVLRYSSVLMLELSYTLKSPSKDSLALQKPNQMEFNC